MTSVARQGPPGPSLSPSRAADFLDCPLLYRYRVVDRIPEPPSPAAVRGTVVHAVLERLFDLPAGERTLQAACALLPGQWARVCEESPELAQTVAADPEGAGRWTQGAQDLVARWFTMEDPTRLEPAERELYLETDLHTPDGGVTLRGYVDRLDVAADGRLRVVDYKTGRAPSPQFESKALFQVRFYALVLWRLRGRVPTQLRMVYLGDGRTLTDTPDEADLLAAERKVRAVHVAITQATGSGDWRPAPGRRCTWCPHRAVRCPAFATGAVRGLDLPRGDGGDRST